MKSSCTWTIFSSEVSNENLQNFGSLAENLRHSESCHCVALGSDAAHHHRRLHMTKDSSGFLLGHLSSISAIAHVTDGVSLISCGIANR